ncbi:MAG: DUF3892 domain-containing protein [Verrucomicrobia bacterium]|nr:DUF3892 domain-containing protein [Verrucomicrobiota bacterium]
MTFATRLEVNCISRSDRPDLHERIKAIGGGFPGHLWVHLQELAIRWIEDGTFEYYVEKGGDAVYLIVAVSQEGQKYLKMPDDGEEPNHLLRLPDCPRSRP